MFGQQVEKKSSKGEADRDLVKLKAVEQKKELLLWMKATLVCY